MNASFVFAVVRRLSPVARRLAVAALVVVPSVEAQTPLLWGNLVAGPHAVGFRLVYTVDHSREYDPEFSTDTTRPPAHRPRPIMIGIWYPAEHSGAGGMSYGQYLDISPGPGPLEPFARRLEAAMRNVVANETTSHEPGAMTPVESRAFERLLNTSTFAVKEAPAATGRFPVILYHPGTAGTYEDNSVLFEYLASRGFIVVSSAYPAPDASTAFIEGDMPGSFADLDVLVNYVRTLPNADADRLGVMGHSYGAWVSFAWAAKTGSPVRALITLDSGFEYDSLTAGPELLQLHYEGEPEQHSRRHASCGVERAASALRVSRSVSQVRAALRGDRHVAHPQRLSDARRDSSRPPAGEVARCPERAAPQLRPVGASGIELS